MHRSRRIAAVAAVACLVSGAASAQGDRSSPPLPELPCVLETAEQWFRVVAVANGLSHPRSVAFLPGGDMLVTERPGRLPLVRKGVLDPQPIAGVPQVHVTRLGGLLDVALHPDFGDNALVYLTHSKGHDDGLSTTALVRGRLDGTELKDVEELFVANHWSSSVTHFGGRIAFGPDRLLYLTVGERQEAQRAQRDVRQGPDGLLYVLTDEGPAALLRTEPAP